MKSKYKWVIVDGAPLAAANPSGVSFLTANLVDALSRKLPIDLKLKLLIPLGHKRKIMERWSIDNRVKIATLPLPLRIINGLQRRRALPPIDILFGKGVYIFPNYRILRTTQQSKVVTYVHDAAYMLFPDTVEDANLEYLQQEVPYSFKHSDKIITLTKSSKQELLSKFTEATEQIEVVNCGVNVDIYTDGKSTKILDRLGIKADDYFLTVGNIEPRKNLAYLIDVYEKAVDNQTIKRDTPLVIVGWSGWNNEGILQKMDGAIANGYRIIHPKIRISSRELGVLYGNAKNTFSLSIHEGFGMVPIESMACGTHPIVSDIPVHREVYGNAASYLTLNNSSQAAKQLEKILTKKNDSATMKKTVMRYSWSNAAAAMIDIVCKLQREMK